MNTQYKFKKGDISLLVTLLVCSILLILLAPLAQKVSVESKISRENLMSQQAIQAAKTGLDAWKYYLVDDKINEKDTTGLSNWPNIKTDNFTIDDSGTNDKSDDWIVLDNNLGIQYRVEFQASTDNGVTPPRIIGKGRVKRGNMTVERTFEEIFNNLSNSNPDVSSVSNSNSIVLNGLILHLDAGNTSSYPGQDNNRKTWYDLSGNKYNGTFKNNVYHDSEYGGVLIFDGDNDYIDLGDSKKFIGNNNAITISQWIYYEVGESKNPTTISIKRLPNSSLIRTVFNQEDQILNNFKSDYIGFLTRSNPEENLSFISKQIDSFQNKWINLVCVVDGSKRSFYINNNQIKSDDGVGMQSITLFTTGSTTIGAFVNDERSNGKGISNDFKGKIASTYIYNRALTSTEIKQNFEATKGRFL